MPEKNLERMIRLAEEFFAVKNDPSQIAVDEKVMARLEAIHPATISEKRNADGPIAWILIIPTTREVMEDFIARRISERDLLDRTRAGLRYEAVYLCSALVLPEYRRQGLAKRMAVDAVRAMQREHPIAELFFWAFSTEGKDLASSIAAALTLPLRERPEET
jgi:ribosomal protein S18 acetylase RimI-like enzyme